MEHKDTGDDAAQRSFKILGASIGRTIERLREKKGLTQEDLVERIRNSAGRLRLHASGLSKIENGHRMPRVNLIYIICQALDIDMAVFFEREARVRRELLEDLTDGEPWPEDS